MQLKLGVQLKLLSKLRLRLVQLRLRCVQLRLMHVQVKLSRAAQAKQAKAKVCSSS